MMMVSVGVGLEGYREKESTSRKRESIDQVYVGAYE